MSNDAKKLQQTPATQLPLRIGSAKIFSWGFVLPIWVDLLQGRAAHHPKCNCPQKAGGHRSLCHQNHSELLPNHIQEWYFLTYTGLKSESALADHGLDSLDTIEIAMQIEEDLGYAISAETLPQFHKVKHFVNYIEQVEAFKKENNKTPLP